MSRARKLTELVALLVVPLVVLYCSHGLAEARGAYWLGDNTDPSYVYLFAGYRISNFDGPFYFQHPGTPLQFLCAVVVAVVGDFSTHDPLTAAEQCLAATSTLIASLLAAAVFFAGWKARTHGLAIALLAQTLPFSLFLAHKELGRVSPEPILLLLVLLISGLLLGQVGERKTAGYLGLLCGIAVTTKVTALPVALGLCLIWTNRRNLLTYIGFTLLTTVAWLLPLCGRLGHTALWFLKLTTRDGKYGDGEAALVPANYLTSLVQGFSEQTGLLLAVVLATCLALRRGAPGQRTLLALSVVGLLQFLLVARHPYAERYALPAVLCLLSVSLGLVQLREWRPRVSLGVTLLLLGWSGWGMAEHYHSLHQFLAAEAANQRAVAEEAEALRQRGAVVVPAYRASDPAFALYFGGAYNGFPLESKVRDAYPDRVLYFHPNSTFRRPWLRTQLPLQAFWDGEQPLYLQQGNFDLPQLPRGLRLGPIHSGSPTGEALYRIEVDSGSRKMSSRL